MSFPLRPRPVARHAAARDTGQTARALGVPLLLAGLVTAGSPGWGSYVIRKGDTLSELAHRYHTTVDRLTRANHLPGNGDRIYAGERLRVPVATRHTTTHKTTAHSASTTVTTLTSYRVARGDTLIGIAKRFRTTTAKIRAHNRIPSSGTVYLGSVLKVPVTRKASAPNTFAGRTYPSSVAGAAARNRAILAHRHVPSRHQMRDLIARTARRAGVDPELALAVSYQESGWNHRRVSVANAIGAMQIVPATGTWMSGVVGRRLDLLDPEDNVLAGVTLLRVLTAQAKDSEAIAGYYQGLRSVRERGMFPDTKQYVANVQALRARFSR